MARVGTHFAVSSEAERSANIAYMANAVATGDPSCSGVTKTTAGSSSSAQQVSAPGPSRGPIPNRPWSWSLNPVSEPVLPTPSTSSTSQPGVNHAITISADGTLPDSKSAFGAGDIESLVLRFVKDRHELGVQILWKDIWDYATALVQRMRPPGGMRLSRKCLRRFLKKNGFKKMLSHPPVNPTESYEGAGIPNRRLRRTVRLNTKVQAYVSEKQGHENIMELKDFLVLRFFFSSLRQLGLHWD